jgi:hypothetical protein
MNNKRMESYDVYMELELYKKRLAKLEAESEKLDEAWSAAIKYAEDEELPRDKWDEADAAAEAAQKAYKVCEEKVETITNIVRLMTELAEEMEFLEELDK